LKFKKLSEALMKDDLQKIPGVGKRIAQDLRNLGIGSIQELKDKDPEELYARLCDQQGVKIDRCMLYVFRCAVYYASTQTYDPELLKWWNWKNKSYDKSEFQRPE
jgi:hypothetical protein